MNRSLEKYRSRMKRVLDHIDNHSGGDLSLDALSDVAAYSKFHFHRQFSAFFGCSVHNYVQLSRLKKAAFELAYRKKTITDIAIGAEFDAPESFSRIFRQKTGQSPSEFRKSPDWRHLRSVLKPYDHARTQLGETPFKVSEVEIQHVEEIAILYVSHIGDPRETGRTLQQFVSWRMKMRLPPDRFSTYSIYHNDPDLWPHSDYREDFCVAAKANTRATCDIMEGIIPGGRCALLEVRGDADNLENAIRFLYRDWLPASGEELRDFPVFCQRLSLFPDVGVHETVARLFLPLK